MARHYNTRPTPIEAAIVRDNFMRFVAGYQAAHGIGPSYQEIADALGFRSRSHVARIADDLQGRGLICRPHNRNRSIVLLQSVAVPRAPDGAPLRMVPTRSVPAKEVRFHG